MISQLYAPGAENRCTDFQSAHWLTLPSLRFWLESQSPDDIVGLPIGNFSCPVSRWARSLGMEDASVGRDSISGFVEKTGVSFLLPVNLQAFVLEVDAQCGGRHDITASEALAIADSILAAGGEVA